MRMWVKGAGPAGGGLYGRKECRRFALTPHDGRTSRRFFNAQVLGHFLQRRYTAFGRRMRGKKLADLGRHNVKRRRGRVMFSDGIGDARRASRCQIGMESCRERGCSYGYALVVAGTFNKQ